MSDDDERPRHIEQRANSLSLASYEIRDLKQAVVRLTASMDAAAEKNEAKYVQKVEANSVIDDRIKENPTIEGLLVGLATLQTSWTWLLRACAGSIFSIVAGVAIVLITTRR